MVALLVIGSAALPACRTDGGIGRGDSVESLVWLENHRRAQYHRDVDRTTATITGIPGRISAAFTDFPNRMGIVRDLYVESAGSRGHKARERHRKLSWRQEEEREGPSAEDDEGYQSANHQPE